MKTSITLLIERLDIEIGSINDDCSEEDKHYRAGLKGSRNLAKELLEIEKQQIIDANQMKTQEKKQKAIELAYGIYWDKVKDFVDENGWVVKRRYNPFTEKLEIDRTEMLDLENIFEYKTFHAGNELSVRPKSLSGIETNNGWISINSEDDLPKENGHYLVFNKHNNTVDIDYINHDYDSHSERWMEFNSHYQKIEKPLKPIF